VIFSLLGIAGAAWSVKLFQFIKKSRGSLPYKGEAEEKKGRKKCWFSGVPE
jgi:hypothetical protein